MWWCCCWELHPTCILPVIISTPNLCLRAVKSTAQGWFWVCICLATNMGWQLLKKIAWYLWSLEIFCLSRTAGKNKTWNNKKQIACHSLCAFSPKQRNPCTVIPLQFMRPPLCALHTALLVQWWFFVWGLLTAYWILSPSPCRQAIN